MSEQQVLDCLAQKGLAHIEFVAEFDVTFTNGPPQDRLHLVLSSHFLVLLKFLHSHFVPAFSDDFIILELNSIFSSPTTDSVTFYFQGITTDFQLHILHASQNPQTKNLITKVRETFQRITQGWPVNSDFISHLGPEYIQDIGPTQESVANGLLDSYLAFSSIRRSPVNMHFLQHVEELWQSGSKLLDLSFCPGIEPKSDEALDFLAICMALGYNTYFEGISLCGVNRPEINDGLALMFSTNNTIKTVTFNDTGCCFEANFFDALFSNAKTQITVLELSKNAIASSGVAALGASLSRCPHVITVLNLEGMNLGSTDCDTLIGALSESWGISLGIEHLNLSGNDFSQNNTLVNWIKKIAPSSFLSSLSLAGTGVSVDQLLPSVDSFQDLVYLDISSNIVSNLDSIKAFIQNLPSKPLQTLKMQNCSIGPALSEVMRVFQSHYQTYPDWLFNLDIGFNPFEPDNSFAPALQNCRFTSLGLAALPLTVVPFTETLQSLCLDFIELAFDQAQILFSQILACQNLLILSFKGGANPLRFVISNLFYGLAFNQSITTLDVTGQQCGDSSWSVLCRALQTNSTLKTLKARGNAIGINGILAWNKLQQVNPSSIYLDLLLPEEFVLPTRSVRPYEPFVFEMDYAIPDVPFAHPEIPPEFTKTNIPAQNTVRKAPAFSWTADKIPVSATSPPVSPAPLTRKTPSRGFRIADAQATGANPKSSPARPQTSVTQSLLKPVIQNPPTIRSRPSGALQVQNPASNPQSPNIRPIQRVPSQLSGSNGYMGPRPLRFHYLNIFIAEICVPIRGDGETTTIACLASSKKNRYLSSKSESGESFLIPVRESVKGNRIVDSLIVQLFRGQTKIGVGKLNLAVVKPRSSAYQGFKLLLNKGGHISFHIKWEESEKEEILAVEKTSHQVKKKKFQIPFKLGSSVKAHVVGPNKPPPQRGGPQIKIQQPQPQVQFQLPGKQVQLEEGDEVEHRVFIKTKTSSLSVIRPPITTSPEYFVEVDVQSQANVTELPPPPQTGMAPPEDLPPEYHTSSCPPPADLPPEFHTSLSRTTTSCPPPADLPPEYNTSLSRQAGVTATQPTKTNTQPGAFTLPVRKLPQPKDQK